MVLKDNLNFIGTRLVFQPNLSESCQNSVMFNHNSISVIYSEFLPDTCTFVDFTENKISSDGLPYTWLDSLEAIVLDYNNIQEIDTIVWPPNLRHLSLCHNPLKQIPFGLPKTLEILNIEGTNVKNIPEGVLPESLKTLIVSGCPIDILVTPENCEVKGLFQPCASSTKEREHVRDIGDWGC